jgi:inner membrane protein
VGESATTSEKNIVLNDDDAIVVLKEMSQFNPTVGIYLSGTLEIDDSEELQIVTDPGKFEAIRKEGNRVILELCPIEQAILVLKDQFVYGTLTAKMITPQPKGL